MAASGSTSRAVYAGLSCGFVFAVPVAAYVATMPFPDANSSVTSLALPFTMGALAGVGILSAVSAVGRRHAITEEGDAEDSSPSASSFSSTAFEQREQDDLERFFGTRRVPKDVPVIARAQDAMSEADAWADIDSILSEDSPISCDAATSKDIYQIAFEELQRETRAAQDASASSAQPTGQAPAWAAASAVASMHQQPATAVAQPAAPSATTVLESPVPASQTASVGDRDELDTEAAQRAALASLDEIDGESLRTASDRAVRATGAGQFAYPVISAGAQPAGPVSRTAAATGNAAVATDNAAAGYAGREDIWASALDILAEGTSGSKGAEPQAVPYVGRHMRPAPAPADAARAAAVAEGRRANEMHQHVNSLIEEELGQVPSSSVRRSSREYLRVIQGGTASMPRLQAEA